MHPIATTRPARRRRLTQRSARSRGVVIMIAVMSSLLIAALIGYVFNTGRHAQLKMETQNAADATAVGGAGYVARSFNIIAMNNVEISRLIAAVQHLDSLPLATEYTLIDEEAHLEALERILNQPIADRATIEPILQEQIQDQYRDIAILREMDDFFRSRRYDVQDLTFYDGPNGRGELWRAMEALDELNFATRENLAQLAQHASNEAGRINMTGGESSLAALVPFRAEFPIQEYDFDDFEMPVTRGYLPDYVDDQITNRGPYDTIFGWRVVDYDREYGPPVRINNGSSQQSGSFESGWSGRRGRGPSVFRPVISQSVNSYRTYGTWNWLARQFLSRIGGSIVDDDGLRDTALWTRFTGMSQIKLNYLWPGQSRGRLFIGINEPREIDHARAPNVFLEPEWILDYDEAKAIERAGTPQIVYARYLSVEESRVETYQEVYVDGQLRQGKRLINVEETVDDRVINTFSRRLFFSPPGLGEDDREGRWFWRDELDEPDIFTISETREQIIDGRVYEVETVTIEETYTTFHYFWLGVNVGPTITIRDPNNFESRADLPGPTDFDHGSLQRPIDGEVGEPGNPFAFLAIAAQPNRAAMWPSRYNQSLHDDLTGIAQAGVFNNHSFDLWTQMWYAQLEPVQDFSAWLDYAQSTAADASVYPDLDTGHLQDTLDYFDTLRPLSEVMLNH